MSSLFLLPDPLNFRGILRVVETNWTGIRDKCPLLRVECSPFAPLSAAQASPAASPLSRRLEFRLRSPSPAAYPCDTWTVC